MIKNLLVCLDGSGHSDVAADYGIHLAKRLAGRLVGLHVLDSRMLEGPLMADISGWIGAQPYGAQLQQFRELMENKGEAVMGAFVDRCEQAGIAAETLIKMGHPATVIPEVAGHFELVIVGQKGEHARWGGDLMGSNAERITRSAIRPCLITPDSFTPMSKILCAFDGSAHASQALTTAVELADGLSVELIILTAAENSELDEAEAISVEGLKLAEAHGLEAVNLVVEDHAEEAVLDTAREQECDMIVVGAYGHSRIREMILGSTSMSLVTRSHLPVMIVR